MLEQIDDFIVLAQFRKVFLGDVGPASRRWS
jgi:hypothetical protein